jgi:hypothetical protein
MVTRLLEGWISDDDVDAAVAILEAPATPADRDTMRDALISPVAKMRTARQKARVEAALASTNAPPEPVKDETPVRQGRPVESAPEPAPGGGFDESGFQHSFAPKYRGERHALKGRIFQAIRAAGKTTYTPSDDDVRLGHGPAESMWWDCLTDSGGESKFDPVAGIDIIPKKDSVTLEEAETEVAELAGLPADKRCPFFDELYGAERAKAAGSSK